MKLKVCGMNDPQNIDDAKQLLPDYLGFIFWKPSGRFFDGVIPELPDSIQKVGVFVDASFGEIRSKIKKHDLDLVQLHGSEDAAFCKKLQMEIPVIKVFSIDERFDFESLLPFENACDFFLFDTKGKLPGGNGVTFNWEILQKYTSKKPFFLSGGIGISALENIKKLKLPIYAIDVNSQFEISPGFKNIPLLKTFKNALDNEL